MFFTPINLVGKSLSTTAIIDKMKDREGAEYIKIDPTSFNFENTDPNGIGDVSFNYRSSRRHSTLSNQKYQVQFVPFNINQLRSTLKKDVQKFEDTKIIDNLKLHDRNDSGTSPYDVEVKANFYDITKVFYELNSINKNNLGKYSMNFDPNNYPDNLKDQTGTRASLTDPRDIDNKVNNIFSFDDENYSIILKSNILNSSAFLESEVGYGKLYLCDIYIDKCEFSDYTESFLKWNFHVTSLKYKKYIGKLPNTALITSLNTALDVNKNNYKKKILYSYIIAINDQK